jgi:cytochrome P450
MAVQFDPFSPAWRRDPYPKYRELREQAPAHWSPEAEAFCVSRHEDVMTVLKDPETFSSRAMFSQLMNGGYDQAPPWSWDMLRFVVELTLKTRLNPASFVSARNLIAEDGESHAQLRNVVNRGFTPRAIEALEPRIREVVDRCLTGLRAGEPFDAIGDLAVPLPVTIIAELLGVESERHADFKRWSNCVIEGTTGPGRNDRFGARYRQAFIEIIRYLKRIAQDRRRPLFVFY